VQGVRVKCVPPLKPSSSTSGLLGSGSSIHQSSDHGSDQYPRPALSGLFSQDYDHSTETAGGGNSSSSNGSSGGVFGGSSSSNTGSGVGVDGGGSKKDGTFGSGSSSKKSKSGGSSANLRQLGDESEVAGNEAFASASAGAGRGSARDDPASAAVRDRDRDRDRDREEGLCLPADSDRALGLGPGALKALHVLRSHDHLPVLRYELVPDTNHRYSGSLLSASRMEQTVGDHPLLRT
jgi:hypothetical protein